MRSLKVCCIFPQNWAIILLWLLRSVRFFLPFKTCSVELALAKDITTNTIWHGELRPSGKLMKWIKNAKGIMYVLKETKQKRKNKERNSSSVVSMLLINGNFLFIESKLHCRCRWNGFKAIGCDKWEFI